MFANGLPPRSTMGWNSRSSCTPRGRSRTGTGQRRSTSKCLVAKRRAGSAIALDSSDQRIAIITPWYRYAVRQQLSTTCASRWNPSTTSCVRETTRLRWGVELRDDLLRHAPSGPIGVNMKIRREGSLSNSVLLVTTVTCCGDHDRSQIGYRQQLYGHSTRLCSGSHARMRCRGARSADRWQREVVVGATGLSDIGSAVNAAVWAAERPRPAK
jgi:hypothetical protein